MPEQPQPDQTVQPVPEQAGYVPAEQVFPGLPRALDSRFNDPHYEFLATLIESVSARKLFDQILETDFSHQCILEFHKVLVSGFDRNAILARNTNLGVRLIDFEIMLNMMVIACHESDITNPAFITTQEAIRQTFRDFVSRSENAQERMQLLRQEFNYNLPSVTPQQQPFQPQQQSQQQQQQQNRGGGFLGRG